MTDPLAEIRTVLPGLIWWARVGTELHNRYNRGRPDIDAMADEANRLVDEAIAEVERLRGLLGRLEWAGTVVFDEWYAKRKCCPVCRGEQDDGHAPGCELAAAIRPTSPDPAKGVETPE
jgi:hypothetical protein